ncbi:uncharacterized protein LOC143245092 isoform X2 [Tachypleus tridentatus]|uniref:uncharacterized protein LOC143245092 isoform X2 n=1 Tax=Tachypleus tridentatus TaxID=6853 RepID=UPI003FCF9314
MLSLSASEQVRFRNKKGNIVTALPVTVEFGKVVKGDRNTRNSSLGEWKKFMSCTLGSEQVVSPTDLLHAVVALYNTCLPRFPPQSVYNTICGEGARTLLLLRNTSEVLQEWESQVTNPQQRRSGQQSAFLGEINNNPWGRYQKQEQENVKRYVSTWSQHSRETNCYSSTETLPSEQFKVTVGSPQHFNLLNEQNKNCIDTVNELHREQTNNEQILNEQPNETFIRTNDDNLVIQKDSETLNSGNNGVVSREECGDHSIHSLVKGDVTPEVHHLGVDISVPQNVSSLNCNSGNQSISTVSDSAESFTEENSHEEWLSWVPRRQSEDNRKERIESQGSSKNSWIHSPTFCDNIKSDLETPTESPFSDIFSDIEEGSSSDSNMDEDDDGDDFSRGLETFLKEVAARRKDRRISLEMGLLKSTHVGIEHKLIASATFQKNYRIPGAKIVYLSFLAVRKKFRKRNLGSLLLKRLKSPSLVGPYDALVVRSENSTFHFFRKNGFTDDVILNSKFRDVDEGWESSILMTYLPPFDGHYPPFPGTKEWNRPEAVIAMEEEMDTWRQKSLEAYQAQVTCLTRLQQEVLRLHNLWTESLHEPWWRVLKRKLQILRNFARSNFNRRTTFKRLI